MKQPSIIRIAAVAALSLVTILPLQAITKEKEFEKIKSQQWHEVLNDPLTRYNPSKWVLDGAEGTIQCCEKGLTLQAGPHIMNDTSHVVLWSRTPFEGDMRIEYDFTRIDRSKAGSVNILYMHAQGCGKGAYERDIMQWNPLREVAAMRTYFNNMNLYHISYAVTDYGAKEVRKDSIETDYIRARRYNPLAENGLNGTDLKPEYLGTGLFKPDVTYHVTVILSLENNRLYMEVSNKEEKQLFWFNIDPNDKLNSGYLGFRQMWGRTSRYKNLRVYQLAK